MTDIVILNEIKEYLRVDYDDENTTLSTILKTAQVYVRDIARLSNEDWEAIVHRSEGRRINNVDYSEDDLRQLEFQLKGAVLYAISYLFEHREEIEHNNLMLSLRFMLSGIREGAEF